MANTTNYNWETPDDTDLVKDGAAAIRTLGSSVDTTTKALNPETTLGDIAYRSATSNTNTRLAIGSAGQVLTVAAGVPSWASPSDQTPLTTKGDVFTFSTVDARLGVGANGTVLTADSAETTGLKWAAPAGGGKLLQLVNAQYSTLTTVTSTSMTDTGLTATITPTLSTSKILVIITVPLYILQGSPATDAYGAWQIVRGATAINGMLLIGNTGSAASPVIDLTSHYYDSPATTSATTYKVQIAAFANGVSVQAQYKYTSFGNSQITLLEIGA